MSYSLSKKIKMIYVVNARIPNDRAHGIQIVNTCEALGKTGIEVILVTSSFPGEKRPLSEHYGISQSFQHVRIFAIDVPGIPFRYAIRNASFFVSMNVFLIATFFKALFTREKIVVYVRGEAILALIPFMPLIPVVFETHQIRNHEWLYRIALTLARGVVVITDGLKKKFVDAYHLRAQKILVARDAVDVEKFRPTHTDGEIWVRHGIGKEKRIALYAGTLSVEKGVDTLAQAAAHVGSGIQLVFLGGTPAQVEMFRKRYESIPNISILGRVDHTLVPRYITAAHVLVLPDLAEYTFSNLYTSPMKLFEYMASGVPIIASKVPSLLEVLDEQSAMLFEPGNAESLAKAIQSALNNQTGAANLARRAGKIVSAFTWDKRAAAIAAHIRRIVHPGMV